MEFKYAKKLSECKCDSIIFPVYKPAGDKKLSLPIWAKTLEGEFDASSGKISILRGVQIEGAKFEKAALFGMGEKNLATPNSTAANFASAFSALKSSGVKSITIPIESKSLAKRIASQISMADYEFTKYKGEQKEQRLQNVFFVCTENISEQISQGKIFGSAANFARELQNEPGNIATPQYVAKMAKEMSSKKGLTCAILSKKDLQKEKMNAMLMVGDGSTNEPKLVVLQYMGNKSKKEFDLAIVGKGVTFDSGGISLKPSSSMDDMKFDKSGACAAIGAMSALKELGVKKNVVAIAALVENMPGNNAYRPGDIVRASNGKTIEILNTDAEGRVVLADALAYACKKYKPKTLIDLATLTGACVVALGDLTAGIMCEDEKLCKQLIDAGQNSGERLWALPSWIEYDEKVKSDVADVKNIGEKGSGGTIAGYSFLRPFADCKNWAHIDIAGTSWLKKQKFGLNLGGTGFGVRLILEYLSD